MPKTEGRFLINAPLKEVIFELHWELDFIPQQNIFVDNGYEEAAINFRNLCQKDFPEFELIAPSGIPHNILTNRVTHRYYKKKGTHPLFQLGPGVFTVNDNNKNYSWNDFQDLISKGIEALKGSYRKELIISRIELRYIDSVDCSVLGNSNKFEFLSQHLNVHAETYSFVKGELVDINFSKRFLLKGDMYLTLTVGTGKDKKSGQDLIVWHTAVNNKERVDWKNLELWLDDAHDHCSETFTKMISQELNEYFSR